MEKVQGLQYRNEDGPTMQFWPIQHEIFPCQGHNDLPQGMPQAHLAARPSFSFAEESTGPHQLPLMWENLSQRDEGNVDASGSKNWKDSWEWNGFLLTAQPTTSGNNLHGGGHPQQAQDSKFKSSSPFDKSEVNGAVNEPTLLELGLNNNSLLMDDDDGLLALKLGGNGHLGGADELSPNVKRSRHSPPETQRPRCQVDNCTADLQNAKDYHRRHKVCEFHAKASKAPVSRIMQRFCQQCSRFHLLQEFDDDRRSCRRRLAGHNRRRRKTQPDTATALACLLADQNALSRIISPLGQLQGKDELEKLLWVLNRGESLQQALLNARAASGDAENKSTIVGGAPSNDLVNAIAKSQLLSNLLLSNPALACNLPAMAAPADTSISVLSNALLATLSQLQHKNNGNVSHGGPAFIQETGWQPDSCTNALVTHAIAKQDAYSRHSTGEQPLSLVFPSSTKNPPVVREPITPPMCSDKSNDSNGDSMDERIHIDSAQRGGMNESYIQQDVRHLKDPSKGYHNTSLMLPAQKFQTAGAIQGRDAVSVHPDTQSTSLEEHLETKALGSDHSSDSGLDKQEQTFQLWFKIFDRGPADLPSSLRKQMLEWLDHLPTEMEGYIRPGCIILTVFLHMPVHAWEKLCRNIEGSLHKLVQSPDGEFWRKGRVLVHLGEASAFIIEGNVYQNTNPKPLQTPNLVSVQPFAVVMGENVDLILKGHNLKAPGTKVICSYEGKCRDKELALPTSFRERKRDRDEEQGMPLAGPDAQQEHAVTFRVGPFKNMGHSFIEVEGQTIKGNTFPIIIADRSICEEVCSLEKEFIRSLVNNRPSEKMRPSKIEADITHFLYELGWLLHRFQWKVDYIDSGIQEFSPARYRWLLRFSVEHGCCAVVRRILDMLFSAGGNSMEHVNLRALETLSEANLLHVAVRSNSRVMVEFLLAYTPAAATTSDLKHRCIFRPDTPCYGGLTPLHVAASMHAANGVVDALTNAPEELWAMAWMNAKDSVGQTPLMYALAAGNHASIELVQNKLQKLGNTDTLEKKGSDARPRHLALSISSEFAKPTIPSSLRKVPLTRQVQHCTCRGREIRTQNLPLRIRGFKAGTVGRPFILSMLAIAAVCVCVGVLMKGPPSVNFVEGPFVWESIKFGFS